jgi:hypothetical protein
MPAFFVEEYVSKSVMLPIRPNRVAARLRITPIMNADPQRFRVQLFAERRYSSSPIH